MEILLQLEYVFNVFVSGATPVRPFLFILYGALLFLALRLSRGRVPERLSLLTRIGALVSAVFMFVFTLATHAAALSSHGISLREFAWFFDSAEITSSGLPHIHTGKSVINATLVPLFPSLVGVTDTARALAASLPPWSVALTVLATLAAVLLAIAAFVYVSRRYHTRSPVERAAFFGLYALVSFIVLIKMIDGGILSDSALVALAAYAALLLFPSRLLLLISFGALSATLAVFMFRFADITLPSQSVVALAHIGAQFATFLSLVFFLRYPQHRIAVLFFAVAAVVFASGIVNANERIYRRALVAPAGSWVALTGGAPEGFEKIGGIGNLTVYQFSARNAFRTVNDVLVALRIHAAYRPVAPFVRTCEERTRRRSVAFDLITNDPLLRRSVSLTPFVEASFIDDGEGRGRGYRYRATITHHPCLDSSVDVLRETLREAGVEGSGIVHRIRF